MVALAEMQMLEEVKELGSSRTATMGREEALKSGRLKYLVVSYTILTDLLSQGQGGRFLKLEGVPPDAMIVDISEHFLFRENQIAMRIWSESFPICPEGSTMPELDVQCSLYQENDLPKPTGIMCGSCGFYQVGETGAKFCGGCGGKFSKLVNVEQTVENIKRGREFI